MRHCQTQVSILADLNWLRQRFVDTNFNFSRFFKIKLMCTAVSERITYQMSDTNVFSSGVDSVCSCCLLFAVVKFSVKLSKCKPYNKPSNISRLIAEQPLLERGISL